MVGISGNNNDINTPNTTPTNTTPLSTPPAPTIPTATPLQTTPSETPEDLDSMWTRWKCGVCNYTYEGRTPLKKCPRCGNEDPDKFMDAD